MHLAVLLPKVVMCVRGVAAEQRTLQRGVVAKHHREGVEREDVSGLDKFVGDRVVRAVGVDARLEPGPGVHQLDEGKALGDAADHGRCRGQRDLVLGNAGLHRLHQRAPADGAHVGALADEHMLLGGLDGAKRHGGGRAVDKLDTREMLFQQHLQIEAGLVELDAEDLARFQEDGLPLSSELIDLVKNYPLPKLDELYIIPNGNSYEEKRDRFIELLRTMPSGLSLIMFRPAVESDGVKMLSHDWQQRIWDAQLMSDELVHQAFKEQQIAFTNWREIMRRFEGIPVHTNEEDGTVEEGEPADVPIP